MRKMKTVKVINSVKFTGYGPDWWNYDPIWDEQNKKLQEEYDKEQKNNHEKER